MTLSCLYSMLLYCGMFYISHTSVTFKTSRFNTKQKTTTLSFIVLGISAQARKGHCFSNHICNNSALMNSDRHNFCSLKNIKRLLMLFFKCKKEKELDLGFRNVSCL